MTRLSGISSKVSWHAVYPNSGKPTSLRFCPLLFMAFSVETREFPLGPDGAAVLEKCVSLGNQRITAWDHLRKRL